LVIFAIDQNFFSEDPKKRNEKFRIFDESKLDLLKEVKNLEYLMNLI